MNKGSFPSEPTYNDVVGEEKFFNLGTFTGDDQIEDLLRGSDDGPKHSMLLDLWTSFKQEGKNDDASIINYFLRFAPKFIHKSRNLEHIIHTYKQQTCQNLLDISTSTVIAEWIYYTNKIEGINTSLEDTITLLKATSGHSTSPADKEVLQIFDILKETYSPDLKPPENFIDQICTWHSIMFKDLVTRHGKIRTSGVETFDKSHKYPHHSLIRNALMQLGFIYYNLVKAIKNMKFEGAELVCYTFALAGFVQFHFVDIHPFSDGNGRLCRFLSKYILDSVCPLPVPMFRSRDSYFHALKNARMQPIQLAPEQLTELLLDEAIAQYQFLLKQMEKPAQVVLIATDEADFDNAMKREYVLENHTLSLTAGFNNLKVGEERVIEIDSVNYFIRKMEATLNEQIDNL